MVTCCSKDVLSRKEILACCEQTRKFNEPISVGRASDGVHLVKRDKVFSRKSVSVGGYHGRAQTP